MINIDLITQSLNEPQREAVEAINGPLLILAGAGSGKTRVLTHRLANIIAQGQAQPDEILCVTFTNKAAKEMESRTFKILSTLEIPIYSQLWISTFHSFCVRVLRQHLTLLDYKPFFAIYDSSEQLSQIKKVMGLLNISDKVYPAKTFQWQISSAKMAGFSPQEYENQHGKLIDKRIIEVYALYEKEMKKSNALDFDDLLLKTYDLFRMYPEILEIYQNKLKFIMVDEYQDTNHIQYLLIRLLAKKHRNLCVVGDEDQSIYSWRGADIKNILNFEKDFSEAKVIKLEENYRSSGNIVSAATAVIKNNSVRKDKTLFTNNSMGELIDVHEENTEYDEARFVTKTISKKISTGNGEFNDYAIFYRTNAQSRVLEEQLRAHSIPYRIVGGIRFYERMEIKDILSYMKLGLNPSDDIAFKRVINVPTRGLGKTTIEKLEEFSFNNQLTLFEGANRAIEHRLFNAGITSKLRQFILLMEEVQRVTREFKLTEGYQVLLELTGYLSSLKKEESEEAESRIQNLEELHNAMTQFEKERGDEATLQAFLEEIALVSDIDSLDQNLNSVTLMTLHISKGLEYPYVFIVGLEENLFPSSRSTLDETEEDVEEERRLAYVGMTRARQKLWLTFTKSRRIWGREQNNSPSRFINEIPDHLILFKPSQASPNRFLSRYGSSPEQNQINHHQSFPNYEDDQGSTSRGPSFTKGMKVRHPTFGVGSIFSTEGSGDALKVSVLFRDNTIKKFVAKYARLERV